MDQEDNAPLTCKPELILSSSIDFVKSILITTGKGTKQIA